jgi:hypothetical protein
MKLTINKFTFALTLFFLIPNINFAQDINSKALFGNWESVSSDDKHLKIFRFEPDGTYYFQLLLSADYSYRIVGNKMIATLLNSNKVYIDTTGIVIKQDTLISTLNRNGVEEVTTMIKVPGDIYDSTGRSIAEPVRDGIPGNYLWKYPNGHTAFSKFTTDGHWLFRLPVVSHKGKYKISSDSLTISYDDQPDQLMKFWVDKKALILTDTKTGNETFYKGVDYFVK